MQFLCLFFQVGAEIGGIVRCFHEAASPAIGLRMAEGLSFEILSKLDPHRREIITRYIFNEEHVDTVTGRVWR